MERRDQILDSAEHLARSRGYDAFSYADLAEEVGIRKASIHHHFPKKVDLGLALIERYRERFVGALHAIEGNGGEQLRQFIALYRAALLGGDAVCLCVAFSAGRDSLSGAILDELNHFHADALLWLERAIALGARDGTIEHVSDPVSEASTVLALVEGAQLIARAKGTPDPFDQATAALLARLR